MFPFWDTVIAPVIQAAAARRVVEIGALRGETTTHLLDALGSEVELHVIDPLPAFDPTEHEQRFGGRYVFHRDTSLNALGHCGPFDIALVDGDHNWYTVYNELRLLRDTARAAGSALPVLILHDVCWPYGRRDLYYAPERIPEEFRQPHRQGGMRPERKRLLPRGGLNATMHNAEVEGGPRNGVMTALDDFVAEHDQVVRRVILPIYFGLAIVVEEERLARQPKLREALDHLESAEGREELLRLSETIRLDAATWEQNALRFREGQVERAARRYLDLLKGSLLDEHYVENEVRIQYLLGCAERGRQVNRDLIRDPARFMRPDTVRLQAARRSGIAADQHGLTAYFPFTAMGRVALDRLEGALQTIRREVIEGDLMECGVGRGGGAIFMRGFVSAYELADRQVFVADRFRSTPEESSQQPLGEGGVADLLSDLTQVREGFERFGLLDDGVRFLQGRFADTLPDAPIHRLALLRIGEGAGADAASVLEQLYDRMADGAFVVVDRYTDPACLSAVDAFRDRRGITSPIERVGWSGGAWRKHGADATTVVPTPASAAPRDRAPLVPAAPEGAIDLSVVVVFYNMRREAARTLHSLTRAYQRGIADLDYEVIVVDNGSDDEERLGADFVEGFGPEFRYLDLGPDAPPSPCPALNHGIRTARGQAFALMIDGAHVVTPGVLRFGMAGLRSYQPAIVATQQWYVGPGQQPEMVQAGYDQAYEDELFRKITWPMDGYRLFEIGHFIGDRDWFDGVIESNCLFVPRTLLEQVGAFDESFSMPGGGYANLELYERLGSSPDVTVATIIGEGSFHQIHGGTTTNDADREERRGTVFSYGEHYQGLRGRMLRGPAKAIHYVGAMSVSASRRTRSRRLTADVFATGRIATGPDGVPDEPVMMPEELKTSFIETFWKGLAWTSTTWLGHRVAKAPTDLVAYQELIAAVRPDWVVETGPGDGGRALFLASICELVDHGQVLSVDNKAPGNRPQHPRITYVTEKPDTEAAFRRVREITGDTPCALVILGANAFLRVTTEFEGYAPLVPVGSYVVVEDTIVNGHPVWPGYGPGPLEAVRHILATHGEFVPDTSMEKYTLTFNPGGFLKRVK